MKVLKKISGVFSALIFVICLLLLLIVIATPKSNTTNSRTVNIAGYSVMNVLSGSMKPTYNVGDIIVVKKINASELKKGDVISFYSVDPQIQGSIVTHRIFSVENTDGVRSFTTKGDNNDGIDMYPVSSHSVLGIAKYRIPSLGKAALFLQTNKLAFFLLIVLPMLVIIALEIKDIVVITHSGDEVADEKEGSNQ